MKTSLQFKIYVLLIVMVISGSNIFAQKQILPLRPPPCAVTSISPAELHAGSGGGQLPAIRAYTENNCTDYTVTEDYSWISYTQAGLYVTITVQANTGIARSGIVRIGNQLLEVFQDCGNYPGAAGSISGDNSICLGQAGVSYSVPAISGATSYVWTVPTGATIAANYGNSITVDYSTSAVSGNITVMGVNSCGSGAISPNYYVTIYTINQPGTISGSSSFCVGGTYTYSVSPVAGASSYSWSLPLGATGYSTTNSINVTFGATSGTISVAAIHAAGCISTASSLSVNISNLPFFNISGGSICPGHNAIVYMDGSTNGISYNCYLNGLVVSTALGTGGPIQFSNPSVAGTYSVKGITSIGCEIPMNGNAVISFKTPSTPATSITANPSTVCQGGSTLLTLNGGSLEPGGVANWVWRSGSGPCGSTIVGYGTTLHIIPSGTTNYFVRAEGGCEITSCVSTTVTVLTPPVITQHPTDVIICDGAPTSFSVTASGAISYQWQEFVDSWTNIPGATNSTLNIPSTSGMSGRRFHCVVTGLCSPPATSNYANIIFSSQAEYSVTGSGDICPGDALPVGLNGSQSGVVYTCYRNGSPLTPTIAGTGGPINFGNMSVAGTYTVIGVTTVAGCVRPMAGSAILTAKTGSTQASSINGVTSICYGSSTQLTVVGGVLGSDANWKWYTGGCGSTLVHTGNSYTFTPTTTTAYYVRAEGFCDSTPCITTTVEVKELPLITNQPINSIILPGQNASFTVNSTGPDLQYQWQSSPTGYDSWTPITGFPASGFNTPILTIQNPLLLETSYYKCLINSSCGVLNSNVVKPIVQVDYLMGEELPDPNRSIDISKPVGTTEIISSVSTMGAATINIPIFTSPGTNNMTPSVSMFYNSQSGNGIMGYGWHLGGLSKISRTGKNLIHDNEVTSVSFSQSDRFIRNGERLMVSTGTYGLDGIYYPESSPFSKITAYGSDSIGPSYFIEETNDGFSYEYGNTVDSKIIPGGLSNSIHSWLINKLTDVNGNYIKYNYTYSDGEYWLKSIDYTGNSSQSLEPYNSIKFYYTTKLDNKSVYYVAGGHMPSTKLLNQISIYCQGEEVKRYTLNYTDEIYSQLVEIIEADKNNQSFNSVIVDWGDNGSLSSGTELNFLNSPDEKVMTVGDFSGDGFDDLVTWKESMTWSGWSLYTNNQNGSFERTDFDSQQTDNIYEIPYRYLLNATSDMTGDGLDEVFFRSNNGDTIFIYVGDTEGLHREFSCSITDLEYFFPGDFNGDGIGELLLIGASGTKIYSLVSETSWNITIPTGLDYRLVDFDGDGKSDLITLTSSGYVLSKFIYDPDLTNYNYSVTNVGTFTSSSMNSESSSRMFEGDFNGDYKTDFLINSGYDWFIMNSTGLSYAYDNDMNCTMLDGFDPFTELSGKTLFVRDINVDGKSDIIEISTHFDYRDDVDGMVIRYHLNKGGNFKTEDSVLLATNVLVDSNDFLFGSFHGEGLMDCLYLTNKIIRLKKNDRVNLVESLINGFNYKTKFIYNNNVLDSGSWNKPSLDTLIYKNFKQFVVDSLIYEGSDEIKKSINYSYSNPFYHLKGAGFIGFANQSIQDNTTGFTITNKFNVNERYLYPYLSEQISTNGSGSETAKQNFVYSTQSYTFGSYFAFPSQIISRDLLHNVIDTNLFYYDSYGNDTLTIFKQNGELVTKIQNKFVQVGSWCPSKLWSSTITKTSYNSDPDYQKFSEFGYDIKGRLIRSSVFVNLADSLNTTFTYNNYGNIVSKTTAIADGNTRSEGLSYDTKYRFATALVKSNLTYGYTYDPATGAALTETYPNSLTKTFEYDGFGRQTKSQIEASKYLTTAYEWSIDSPDNAVYSITQSDGLSENKAWFDDSGKTIRNQTTSFDGSGLFVDKQYSPRGNLIRESKPYFTGTPAWNVFSYDTIGRIESYSVNGSTLNYSYNGNETTTTRQLTGGNRVYTVSINGIGQVSSTTQNSKTLNFSYGNNGGLTSVTPPFASSSVSYNYDSRPMLDEEHDPDRGTSKFKYNSLGELTHFETAKGDADSIIYDIVGRDSIRIRVNGNTNYSYYESGVGKGKVYQIISPAGTKEYSYDLYGNVIEEKDITPTLESFPFTYEYDDHGRISRMTYPEGFAITYHYNLKGFLQYIKKASDESIIWQCNSVNEYGNITQYSLSAGNITVHKLFDENGYLTEIKTLAGSTTKQWFEYYFNPNSGDLEWRKDHNRSLTENFGYDIFDQLKWSKVNGQDSLKLDYNDIGNIMYKSDVGDYIYNTNRVHAVDSINGSQNMERQNVGYNFFNKPVYISTDADSLVYVYNPLDQRIKAVLYNSSRQVVKTTWYAGPYEKVIQGTETKHYYYINSPDGLVAIAIQEGAGTPVNYYICKDHLGSITGIMNSAGNILEESNFDPWGRRRNPVDWSYSSVSTPTYTQRGFTGHEHLDMFNLIHMNGRIYDSEIARFLSPDPVIQDPYNLLNYNRYSYCLNNPLKYSDPSGYWYARKEEGDDRIDSRWLSIIDYMSGGGGYGGSNNSWNLYQLAVDDGYDQGYGKFMVNLSRQESLSPLSRSMTIYTWTESTQLQVYQVGGMITPYGYVPGSVDIINISTVHSISIDHGGTGWEPFVGTAASVASEMYYSKKYGTWMGKNFKMYRQKWGGNRFTGGKNKFGKTMSNSIKWGGRALGAWSAYSIQRDYAAGEMGTGWMMVEQGTNAVSTFGGIYGAAWGVGWELGRAITILGAYQEFKFNFWYNRMENAIGPPSPTNEDSWYDFFNNYGR